MKRKSLTILHTNDLHSRFDVWTRLAYQARELRRQLESQGEPVLMLDAGDHLDFSNTIANGTGGLVNIRLLESLGYHAFVPGNNETIRQSRFALVRLAQTSKVPWLAANLNRGPEDGAPEPLPGLPPDVIIHLPGLRIGVIGVTVLFERIFPYLGIGWQDTQEAIAGAVERLRTAGCDLVVLLSHLGLEEDRALAASSLDLDVIVGGHSHHTLETGETLGGIPILQAGAMGRFLGRARLELEKDRAGRWRVTGCKATLLPVDPGGSADESSLRILEEGQRDADRALEEAVAHTPADLDHQMTGESPLGRLVAAALRERWQADIGLVNGGAMIAGLQAGPVTRRDILESFPSLVSPGLLEILGEDLWLLLEKSEDPRFSAEPVWGVGLRGEGVVLGRVFADGLTWEAAPPGRPGGRVRNIRVHGESLDPNRWYRAGACTLLAMQNVGYAMPARVRVLDRLWPDLVRDVFSEWLARRYPPRG